MNLKSNTGLTNANRYFFAKQQGVVLFFALIALVVMSLAAVALIRSVDTNTLIAGNLSFKQSATASADSGIETAIAWIGAQAGLDNNNTTDGYYATSSGNAKALADASAKMATGVGISSGKDSSGNTVSYVIQRMCRNTGPSSPAHCLFGPPADNGGSLRQCDPPPCLNDAPSDSLMYRVTVRVVGPKNTVSYTQAFVY